MEERLVTKSQLRFIIVTFVAAVTTGIGYWQWPQRTPDLAVMPISDLILEWTQESRGIRDDFEKLKARVERINVLQAVVLERWKVQDKLNEDTDERLDIQEHQ